MTLCPYGYRILGDIRESRRLVDADVAFAAYCQCDERADVATEAYLSAYQFDVNIRSRADQWGRLNVAGYTGACWSPWLWIDIDVDGNLEKAKSAAVRVAEAAMDRYGLKPPNLLIFFSGSKGFHLGVPTSLWAPEPSLQFPRAMRYMAECLAGKAKVKIDTGIYDRVRAFRAPNSRHPKTGLYKRQITFDALERGTVNDIHAAAQKPEPFELPAPVGIDDAAIKDWEDAMRQGEVIAARQGLPRLNRKTLDFIRNPTECAPEGDRHNMLFSAAANLAEFDCPSQLAHALLSDAARDTGLAPADIYRQIECGLKYGRRICDHTNPATYENVLMADGRIRTTCRRCGRFMGYLPADNK